METIGTSASRTPATAAHPFDPTPTLAFPNPPLQDPGALPHSQPPRLGTHPSPGSAPSLVSLSVLQLLLWPQPLSARPPSSPRCQPAKPVGEAEGRERGGGGRGEGGNLRKNTWQVGNLSESHGLLWGPPGGEMENARPAPEPHMVGWLQDGDSKHRKGGRLRALNEGPLTPVLKALS